MSALEAGSSSIAARAADEMQRHLNDDLAPGLYLVATPIGNLGDVTLRALSVLARADVVLCEDTRHSRTLLSHFGISTQTRPYHEHNAARERPRVLRDLEAGRRIALISDAGTPLVSDPGWKLVRAALDAGHRVEALPGASAALAALSVAGLPTDAFFFAGFLPPRSAARRARIAELKSVPGTLLFFEAPSRVAETLADLAAVLGRSAGGARARADQAHRGGAPGRPRVARVEHARGGDQGRGRHRRRAAAAGGGHRRRHCRAARGGAGQMSLRDAAKAVAEALGVPKSRVYELGLRKGK